MMFVKHSMIYILVLAAVASASRLPPSHDKSALMARFILNEAEWTTIATTSVNKKLKGQPFSNLKSVADGAIGKGNGVPYVFLTPLDFSAKDLAKDPHASFMMTLAQGEYCKDKGYDPMDPRCARVIFNGKVKKIETDDPEYQVAKNAIYTRHTWLQQLPEDHHFYFAKLDIENIIVIAFYGGAKYVDVNEYRSANAEAIDEYSKPYR